MRKRDREKVEIDSMNCDALVEHIMKEPEEVERAELDKIEIGSAKVDPEAKAKVDPALAEAILQAMRNAGFNPHGVA